MLLALLLAAVGVTGCLDWAGAQRHFCEGNSVCSGIDADAGADAGPPKHELYVTAVGRVGAGIGSFPSPLGIEVIDLDQQADVRDVSLIGTVAMAYRDGKLWVAQGYNQHRISVLDPDSLAVLQTIPLPWDPRAAVFSVDGGYVFIARAPAMVDQVRLPSGTVASEVQIPLPALADGGTPDAGPENIMGLALNSAETLMATTLLSSGSDPGMFDLIDVSGESLLPRPSVAPPPISGCTRQLGAVAFAPDDTEVATYDANCDAMEFWSATTGALATASVYTRSGGASAFVPLVWTGPKQAWSANFDLLHRGTSDDPSAKLTMPFSPSSGGMVWDPRLGVLHVFKYDPHTNGVFALNPADGGVVQEPWDLSLFPLNSNVSSVIYVSR